MHFDRDHYNVWKRCTTRRATTLRFVPLHQPKYLRRLLTVVCSDGQQCEALYNTAVFTSDAKNIQYSSIKRMPWKVNSIVKLEKKSTWWKHKDFKWTIINADLKARLCVVSREQRWLHQNDAITFYRSFIHNGCKDTDEHHAAALLDAWGV